MIKNVSDIIDDDMHNEGAVLAVNLPCRRLVYAPTGKINRDFDDVRSYMDASGNGMRRALKAGIRKPLLPIQLREDVPSRARKVDSLLVWGPDPLAVKAVLKFTLAVEQGRYIARDIGGGDPERMTPFKATDYIQSVFKNSSIKINVIREQSELEKNYPLFAAVNRAASVIPRHQGCVVWLEYTGAEPADASLLLVGKGVTYDTGGADIKAGGVMAGMSRDKCGAAAIAGFFKTLDSLQPKGIVVKAALGFVRNSVGENCYVADEVITSRKGARVRVGNTDAEGRMVMADLLCEMKEKAKNFTDPHLMTIATLTGHAVLTVGHGYSIVMDNAVAREAQHAQKLQKSSEIIGDPFEISTVRREDYNFHRGKGEGDDVLQCNNLPSSRTPRGHQGPAAFLVLASGLDEHGLDSELPLKYSHLDIAAAAGDLPNEPTGAPILSLAFHHLLGRF
ncbi:hypothetical protein B566_EDAN009359 [Ephemera danica]|nr:hypothetical protein B566_EDAN009359 [Ephemera danica]